MSNTVFELSDVTFLIPTRLDSIDRLVNLRATVKFILEYFDTNIHILEADNFNSGLIDAFVPKRINYSFIEDFDTVFFRTRYINMLAQQCTTPFLSVWDSDIIVSPEQIIKTVQLLRENEADFVYPYENKFLDTSSILRRIYLKSGDIDILKQHAPKMKELYPPNPVGGAFFANTNSYLQAGGENETFYGWGLEDGERFYRWHNLGYKVTRVSGPMFHLSHSRGINSVIHNADQQFIKRKEVVGIRRKKNDKSLKIENDPIKYF